LLAFYKREKEVETDLGKVNIEMWCVDVKQLNKLTPIFESTTIDLVIDLYKKHSKPKNPNTYLPDQLYVDDLLLLAIKIFVFRKVYQVPVFRDNLIIGFITQQDINSYLHQHSLEFFPKFFYKSIKELFNISEERTVSQIHQQRMAIEAFQMISNNKVSAVAVVEDSGKIVANFSASDLVSFQKIIFIMNSGNYWRKYF